MKTTMQADRPVSRRRRGFVLGAGIAFAAVIAAAGCGDEGPARQAVSGTVALDGKPLATGTITFAPVEGVTAATAEVVDGAFQIGRTTGPTAGHYLVEIVADRTTGKTIPNPDFPEKTIEEVHNVIPQRYNVRTELKAEVKPVANEPFTFNLSSRTATAPRTRRR
jgi:hypothetical protein